MLTPADPDSPTRRPPLPPWRAFARAPLLLPAIAATLGLIADRYASLPADAGFAVAAAGLVGWLAGRGRNPAAASACLLALFAGLAAAHHHTHRQPADPHDIARLAARANVVAKVRGVVEDAPVVRRPTATDFAPTRRPDRATAALIATEAFDGEAWKPAAGRVRLTVDRFAEPTDPDPLHGVRAGDEVEAVGRLTLPHPPANPGERDYAAYCLDQGVRAELRVAKAADGVVRIDDRGRWSLAVLPARVRGHFARLLDDAFDRPTAGLARALLLGDGSAMERAEWDAFARTGVVHVLAISGQHLVILAGFVWLALRVAGVRRRSGAWAVLLLVLGYAIVTGLRPSAVRAVVAVAAACGGLLLLRPAATANVFLLAWLIVIALDPTDPFAAGCQLSFISVFVLIWGVGPLLAPAPPTPLDRLIDESRPPWLRAVRALGRWVVVGYVVTLALTAANAPLVMTSQNVVPPVGVPIGPPLVVLTAVALLAGFVYLLIASVLPMAGEPFAAVCGWCLRLCDRIVHAADVIPGGTVYVPDPPLWWLAGFYALVAAAILLARRRLLLAALTWTCVGLVGLPRPATDELRVTLLAVGHGACAVLETPDGRVIVCDAGSTAGPDVVRRTVAPYLWGRGIARIDELFVSHADADHFNGVAELVRRFPVGRATLNPSFADKPTADVADALLALKAAGVPTRTASAGDRFTAGDVSIEVLHPPPDGPPGSENERSLVLLVRHGGHAILLPGDLEKAGTARVLALPPVKVDVLVAPHHGSRPALPQAFLTWCSPGLIAVSRGTLNSPVADGDAGPTPVWDTITHGAVTIRSHPTGLTAESFRTGERRVIRRGNDTESR